jgi:hypothetical protein
MDSTQKDDSIIDVSGDSFTISYDFNSSSLKTCLTGVPEWKHRYVYSFSELNGATKEQVSFYYQYKKSFLLDEYLDLEGNNNYAFILLFDLLKDYNKHHDLALLEKLILSLGVNYPKTRPYGLSSLTLKLEEKGDLEGIERIKLLHQNLNNDYNLKLGNKYKKKLNLTAYETELLNRIWYPDNSFCNIEFCLDETVKLFLLVIKALEYKLLKENMLLELELNSFADFIAFKQLGEGMTAYSYKYAVLSAINHFYTLTFKYTENALREAYGHTRKLNTELQYPQTEIIEAFDMKVLSKIKKLLLVWISRIEYPNEQAEIALNNRNTSRWKISFQNICQNYGKQADEFFNEVLHLAELNKTNPSVEHIYFEASKFIAAHDKVISLKLYIHYIYEDLKSVTFDNRALNKTIQKSLFTTGEQLKEFEAIINNLIISKDLGSALKAVSGLYLPKRKKIVLNHDAINQINEKHSDTVELLNKFLLDEVEENSIITNTAQIPKEEIRICIVSDKTSLKLYNETLEFSPIQMEVIALFRKGNFTVPAPDLENFAKSKGAFKNQLIDRINEICYDLIDDILIEEEEDNYIINENYYNRILLK